jgi:hypothetical protein
MARYRRYHTRPTFGSQGKLRLMSMIMMLAVLWMLYQRMADPTTWRWMATLEESSTMAQASAAGGALPGELNPAPSEETIVPTPGPDDPDEQDSIREEFQAVTDRAPLEAVEMPAYWRLMRWSRGQSLADLERVARRDVMFTQLWEEPDKYRGQLIRLKLHVVRTLAWDAPADNKAGVRQVYEGWGTTSESRSFPYVVVFSELPPQMPLGHDIAEEAVFVGYFLKNMSYQDFKVTRGAPLLVGRLQWQENPARTALKQQGDAYFLPVAIGGALLVLAMMGTWFWKFRHRHQRVGTIAAAGAAGIGGAAWWEQVQAAEEGTSAGDGAGPESHGRRDD